MIKESIYHKTTSIINLEYEQIKKTQQNVADFAPLYDSYFLAIFNYVLKRVQDEHHAAEITSDIFAKALFKISTYNFKGLPFSSWLYRIARNQLIDFYRKDKSNKYLQVSEEELNYLVDNSENDIEAVVDKENKTQQLVLALGKLSDDNIELIELKFFENRSYKEIAEIINTNENNARVKTNRALTKLKDLIK
ncbi:MAG: sigma-70 family RNA polymerase sigma factor [Vicingaceae bacterium]|nr:sigma-70 family RNA polymerase sigma factor [Vicingaceae bacterium]